MSMHRTALFVQEACYAHRYIRNRDDSAVVERPERLRSVALGLAAAIARIEETHQATSHTEQKESVTAVHENTGKDLQLPKQDITQNSGFDADSELSSALDRLTIEPGSSSGLRNAGGEVSVSTDLLKIVKSTASASLLEDAAVKFIHGDIEGPGYIDNFVTWTAQSETKIAQGQSEIPEGLHQGDLYLCSRSRDAVSGALGTVCEAVDNVIATSKKSGSTLVDRHSQEHAFVAVRPPGHHCGEDTPSGFCFVNNVMVGAAHAHLKHGVNRVIVFDFDLHHGNGTQAIVWSINEEAYRAETEADNESRSTTSPETSENSNPTVSSERKRPLKAFYGSIHDVLSYPCEDGKLELIQAASTTLNGPHGQWISNIHLLPYESDEEFFSVLYPQYTQLIKRAEAFVKETCEGEEVLVFISSGFDASLHEYDYMSRHGRKVPTSFYYRFTRDIVEFAAKHAKGRVVSVLEGGYSQRALASGAFAHIVGLVNLPATDIDESWWNVDNLIKLEGACKPKARRTSATGIVEHWLERVQDLLPALDFMPAKPPGSRTNTVIPMERMTLRERKVTESPTKSANNSPRKPPNKATPKETHVLKEHDALSSKDGAKVEQNVEEREKKLPRVILRVKQPE